MNSGDDQQQYEDQRLMARITGRDESALAALYDRHAPLIYGLCIRILGSEPEAQAILSEVFFEVWERATRYDPKRGAVRTYLVTVARSRALDQLRSNKRRAQLHQDLRAHLEAAPATDVRAPDPSADVVLSEECSLVRAALAELAERQRLALEMAYFGGLSQAEIADRLGIPLGTVKSHIRQGLRKLRGTMSRVGVDGDPP